jgi:hypothetical protein
LVVTPDLGQILNQEVVDIGAIAASSLGDDTVVVLDIDGSIKDASEFCCSVDFPVLTSSSLFEARVCDISERSL